MTHSYVGHDSFITAPSWIRYTLYGILTLYVICNTLLYVIWNTEYDTYIHEWCRFSGSSVLYIICIYLFIYIYVYIYIYISVYMYIYVCMNI